MDLDFSLTQNYQRRKWPKIIVCLGIGYILTLLCGCQPHLRLVHTTPISPTSHSHVSIFPPESPAEAANEWRQAGANSSHSRSLSATLSPPLRTIWRTKLPFPPNSELIAGGSTLYLDREWGDSEHLPTIMAINAVNGSIRWMNKGTVLNYTQAVKRLCATSRGVFAVVDGHLQYLRATDGSNLLASPKSAIRSEGLVGMVENTLYFYSDLQSPHTSFQTLDMPTLKVDPITGLSIPGSDSYGFEPEHGGYFFPDYLGSLGGTTKSKSKIRFFMQDTQNVITTEGPPSYHPHGLVFAALNNGVAVGGGSRAYLQLSAGDYVFLEAINPHGKIVWQYRFPKQYRHYYGSRDDYDYLAATQSRVFVHVGPLLYAFDGATGHIVWTARYERPSTAFYRISPLVMGNVLYILSSSTPVPFGGVVPGFVSKNGLADSVSAFSVTNGHRLWSRQIGHNLISMISHHNALYLMDSIPHKHDQNYDYFLIKLAHKQ